MFGSLQEAREAVDLAEPTEAEREEAQSQADALLARYGEFGGSDLLEVMIREVFPGRITLVSSFGAEAAALLHMVSRIDPAVPISFVDTGRLFGETLRYRDTLVHDLGLRDVRTVRPDPERVRKADPELMLWRQNADVCCFIRKVEPMQRALEGFDAWITGRKAYHGGERKGLPHIEALDGRVKLNPLARWTKDDLDAYFAAHDLPRHPLEEEGFLSIGCLPCTDRVAPGEDARAGRWRGQNKSECGIHFSLLPKAS